MEEQIKKFITDIKLRKFAITDEATTKQIIILRLFSILGWNIYDPNEVQPEYSIEGKRVDYSLRYQQQNKVFVEVKKVDEDLEMHQEQLLNYAFLEGIKIAVLTNGLSWWFYLPLNPGSWEQRKFFSIDILQQEENELIQNFISFLSKENIITEKALSIAESLHKNNQRGRIISISLPNAWNKIIQETDEALINLINDTNEKICGFRATNEQIAEFLNDSKERIILMNIDGQPKNNKKSMNSIRLPRTENKYSPTGYIGKRPASVVIGNKKYEVRYWIDILLLTCEFLYKTHGNEFEQKALSLRGSKRAYISKNKDELFGSRQIVGSPFYVETDLNANLIVRLSENLMTLFGYGSDLHIEIR